MMKRVVIDAALRKKLYYLIKRLELCDENSRVLAILTPKLNPEDWKPWEPQISESEIERRRNSTKWYTTRDVLDHLAKLDS